MTKARDLANIISGGFTVSDLPTSKITSGTDVRYKCEWVNQVSGTKEAQVHGIGINY